MTSRDEMARLREMAKMGDKSARDELVRILTRRQSLDGDDATRLFVTVVEESSCKSVNFYGMDEIGIEAYDPRFVVTLGRVTLNTLDVHVLPLWGPPPQNAPRMQLTLVVNGRTMLVELGDMEDMIRNGL